MPVVLIVVSHVCLVFSRLGFPTEPLRRRWLDWLRWSTLFLVEGLAVAAVAVHGGAGWGGDGGWSASVFNSVWLVLWFVGVGPQNEKNDGGGDFSRDF